MKNLSCIEVPSSSDFFFDDLELQYNQMSSDEKEEEKVEEINISWYGCCGIELTDEEVKDVEQLYDDILNNDAYFDDSDAWIMEFLLFQIYGKDILNELKL